MIQIIALRDYINKKGKNAKAPRFFGMGMRLEKIQDVFDQAKVDEQLQKISDKEHYNMYFTMADCFEEKERQLKEQWAIPFDIDDILIRDESTVKEDAEAVVRVAAEAIGVPYDEVASLFSGHGVQLFVLLTYAIRSDDYFVSVSEHYKAITDRINVALIKAGLQGKSDPTVWSHARLMRLPGTMNQKTGKPTRKAFVLQSNMVARNYNLVEESGLKNFTQAETVSDDVLKRYPKPDTKGVLNGCEFLKWARENQKLVKEPQWYAQISVEARLTNGRELVHEHSQHHPGYSYDETETKIDQALSASGPRTCKDISTRWDGCPKCPYWGVIKTPIMIRGEDYIKWKDFHFREQKTGDDGVPKPSKVAYQDLIKELKLSFQYMTIEGSEIIYVYNGKYWEEMNETRIKEWMTSKVKPEPMGYEMKEFLSQLRATNVRKFEWFQRQQEQKMNFKNCALNLKTMEQEPHSPDHGFLTVLNFDYDPFAIAPTWEKFLTTSMASDKDTMQLLEEFGGYILSGDVPWAQKALLLLGEGENGKSIYSEIIAEIVGKDFRSVIPTSELGSEYHRYNLVRSLFNYSEETSYKALTDSAVFKLLIGGGSTTGRQPYGRSIDFQCKTKFVIAANHPPYSTDRSHGFFRRFIIVPWNVRFEKGSEHRDDFLREKLELEFPGICNRLISAYQKIRERRRFTTSKAIEKAMSQYKEELDNVIRFLDDECVVTPNSDTAEFETKEEVFGAYQAYCKLNEERPLQATWFWRQMKVHIKDLDARLTQRVLNGHKRRILLGVQITRKEF